LRLRGAPSPISAVDRRRHAVATALISTISPEGSASRRVLPRMSPAQEEHDSPRRGDKPPPTCASGGRRIPRRRRGRCPLRRSAASASVVHQPRELPRRPASLRAAPRVACVRGCATSSSLPALMSARLRRECPSERSVAAISSRGLVVTPGATTSSEPATGASARDYAAAQVGSPAASQRRSHGPRESPQRLALVVGDAFLRALHLRLRGPATRAEAFDTATVSLGSDGQDHRRRRARASIARIFDDREPVHVAIAVLPIVLDPQAIGSIPRGSRRLRSCDGLVAGLGSRVPITPPTASGRRNDDTGHRLIRTRCWPVSGSAEELRVSWWGPS